MRYLKLFEKFTNEIEFYKEISQYDFTSTINPLDNPNQEMTASEIKLIEDILPAKRRINKFGKDIILYKLTHNDTRGGMFLLYYYIYTLIDDKIVQISISKKNNEWFYVNKVIDNRITKWADHWINKFFECDQIDGLIKLISDIIEEKI